MNKQVMSRVWVAAAVLASLGWALAVNGAVPGFATPTLGQAASMLGYAQAFADQHWYSLHARSFGYPVPTSLATGLPLAWFAGLFLRLGLAGPDAYSAAVACWLTIGFAGAWSLAVSYGLRSVTAALAAGAWMSLPIIWAHQGYSSLALGMALLPTYLFLTLSLFVPTGRRPWSSNLVIGGLFCAACVLALFMDGYTFMMFAVAAGVTWLYKLIDPSSRRRALTFALPVCIVGFGGAYVLYTRFVGRSAFDPAPLDVFRGWGLDLTFLVKPSSGGLWLWDALHWTTSRSEAIFYGDASVWTTTFALPLAIVGLACFASLRGTDRRAWLLLAIAAFGLYMALGPSLKVDAVKPPGLVERSMTATPGIYPTGTALLSEHVPGFRIMRAAYRWEGLFLLGMWGLVALRAARSRGSFAWNAGYIALIVAVVPHLGAQWGDYRTFRRDFGNIDRELAEPLGRYLRPGSRVLFMPYNNDVMANYLSPKLHVVSYNVGGDKQVEIARPAWPDSMSQFVMNRLAPDDASAIRGVLLEQDADAIVIPYFNSLYAAHVWPCPEEAKGYSAGTLALFESRTDFWCPQKIREAYSPAVEMLRGDPVLSVKEEAFFAVVALRPEYQSEAGRQRAWARTLEGVSLPLNVIEAPDAADRVLVRGWHAREPGNRWSGAHARLLIPISPSCQETSCVVHLGLAAFAASATRPVTVALSTGDPNASVSAIITDTSIHTMAVTLPTGREVAFIEVDVPQAASPAMLDMNSDSRVLGVSLSTIEISPR